VNGNSHHVTTKAADSTSGAEETTPTSLAGYDDILNGLFVTFKELSVKIGPDVKTIVRLRQKNGSILNSIEKFNFINKNKTKN
jgi:hypothetical protein